MKASIPKGTRDFLPTILRQRNHIMNIIRETYESHGFSPIETPAIENLETLMGKYGDEGDQLLFKILKRGAKEHTGEADLGLRYDLTVPLARFVAMHQNELPNIFKRYQLQPVYRADRPAHGRFREFYQCDLDIIGENEPYAEIELLAAVMDTLEKLKLNDNKIIINDRRILRSLINLANIPEELEITAITAIDKLDKIGQQGVQNELEQRGIPTQASQKLLELIQTELKSVDDILSFKTLFENDSNTQKAIDNIILIINATQNLYKNTYIQFTPSLARGLNYYTGAIFEIQNQAINSSIAGGGRYDNLIATFANRQFPACGISLGFERICTILAELQKLPVITSLTKVLITCFDQNFLPHYTSIAAQLRKYNISTELYAQPDKLAKQFKYANENNIPWVITIGPDEYQNNKLTLKNMLNASQSTISLEETISLINNPE